ncbi:MAG: Gfo/Idh/MocA family oxidoreductase [Verrucomicrobia bacterium]|nr:Gfo/Idh/MocA family oxidoreductase [Verrucomicrobiota bacterium]
MKTLTILQIGILGLAAGTLRAAPEPVRFAIVGLVHDHARGFIPTASARKDIQLVAIVEPNRGLAARYARDYRLPDTLFHTSLESMLDQVKPQAVAAFTSTFDHRRVVEACAARGAHVMMEKPLAVDIEHARAIAAAAEQGGIQVLINYETTWYPANHAAYALVHEQNAVGDPRKIVVRDGHQGPKEIGCSAEFLEWLTDPVLNGGGALTDFGCYGANLITWLMKGERPTSVFAVTQQIKPDVYPHVDDEATIVLTYPQAQGIIQASWNWPFNRKDMDIYGRTGYVRVPDQNRLRVRRASGAETDAPVPPLAAPENDPLSFLAAVVRGEMRSTGLSSLEVNLIATEILDAARESARTGQRVVLPAETTATERDKLLFGSCQNHRKHLNLSLHLDMVNQWGRLPPYQANEPGYAMLAMYAGRSSGGLNCNHGAPDSRIGGWQAVNLSPEQWHEVHRSWSARGYPGFPPFYWCGKPNPLQSRVFCTLGLDADEGHWFLDHNVLPEPVVRWRIAMLNRCLEELGLPAIDVDVPDGVAWESFEGEANR